MFINIFGGITRCDLVAEGVLGALERVEATVPIVVRLDGTNAEEGRAILADAAHPRIVAAATMLEAAERAAAPRERGGGVSILVGADTRLVVQGITGKEGTFHTLRNRAYGTNVVAGVTPGKAGQDVEGIPVFDTVAEAVRESGANTSMIFVPPRFAAEAILEAADAGVRAGRLHHRRHPGAGHGARAQLPAGARTTLVGPNCPA